MEGYAFLSTTYISGNSPKELLNKQKYEKLRSRLLILLKVMIYISSLYFLKAHPKAQVLRVLGYQIVCKMKHLYILQNYVKVSELIKSLVLSSSFVCGVSYMLLATHQLLKNIIN